MPVMGKEAKNLIKHHFQAQEELHGYTNPRAVATAISHELGTNIYTQRIEREVLRIASREYLYEGAADVVRNLLETGDTVTIWTQGHERGQLWKVAMSGIGKLRHNLPPLEKKRLSVISAMDKIAKLPELFTASQAKGLQRIMIIDDKATNIVKASEQVTTARENHILKKDTQVIPIWINQGRTKNKVPEPFSLASFKEQFPHIEDIRAVLTLKQEFANEPISWLIDFDHTLVHSAAMEAALCDRIAGLVSSQQQ